MEKESLLNYLYRFFDIIVLLFIVFDFGYDFEENYNSPHVIGLIILSIALLAFNAFKYFTYKYESNKNVALVNFIILVGVFIISAIIIVLNIDFSWSYILQKIKPALYITGALFVIAFYFYATQSFKSTSEADLIKQVQQIPDPNQRAAFEAPVASLVDGLAADRQAMFSSDLFKSLGLAAVLFVAIFLYYKKFISKTIFIIAVGFVALFDLFKVDLQYFNASNFSDPIEAEANFNPSPTDAALLKDTSYYRVLDLRGGIQAALMEVH